MRVFLLAILSATSIVVGGQISGLETIKNASATKPDKYATYPSLNALGNKSQTDLQGGTIGTKIAQPQLPALQPPSRTANIAYSSQSKQTLLPTTASASPQYSSDKSQLPQLLSSKGQALQAAIDGPIEKTTGFDDTTAASKAQVLKQHKRKRFCRVDAGKSASNTTSLPAPSSPASAISNREAPKTAAADSQKAPRSGIEQSGIKNPQAATEPSAQAAKPQDQKTITGQPATSTSKVPQENAVQPTTPVSSTSTPPSIALPGSTAASTATSTSTNTGIASASQQSSSSTSSTDPTKKPSGAPTQDQFNQAVAGYSKTSAGGTPPVPPKDVYDNYIKFVASEIPLEEQAMFLANSIWETGAFQYVKEIACSNGSCAYGNYYGRGMLQLTWNSNYQAASKAIYGDDTLLNNPDLAATGDGVWRTALWYWKEIVHPKVTQQVLDARDLGVSVRAINGAIECPATPIAQNRLAIYNHILSAWGIGGTGSLAGC